MSDLLAGPKRQAAERAVEFVQSDIVVGLGVRSSSIYTSR